MSQNTKTPLFIGNAIKLAPHGVRHRQLNDIEVELLLFISYELMLEKFSIEGASSPGYLCIHKICKGAFPPKAPWQYTLHCLYLQRIIYCISAEYMIRLQHSKHNNQHQSDDT